MTSTTTEAGGGEAEQILEQVTTDFKIVNTNKNKISLMNTGSGPVQL